MSDKDNDIRPLYAYLPNYLHEWLDDIKTTTEISKSDVVNLMLEIGKKYFTTTEILKIHDRFLILGVEGLELPQVSRGSPNG